MTTSLLLIGHGSRHKDAVTEYYQFAEQLSHRLQVAVTPCFLEFADPPIVEGIRTCIEAGAKQIVALPLFLGPAGHQKNDVPTIINWAKAEWPELQFQYGTPLGAQPQIVNVLGRRAEQAIATSSRTIEVSDTALLLVGRGSRDPDSNSEVYKIGRMLWEGRAYGWVEVAFYSLTEPSIPEAIDRCIRLGAKRVVVLPYLLFTGVIAIRTGEKALAVQGDYPDVEILIGGHLGDDSDLIEAVVYRYEQVIEGTATMTCDLCKYRHQFVGFEAEHGLPQTSDHHHGLRGVDGHHHHHHSHHHHHDDDNGSWQERVLQFIGRMIGASPKKTPLPAPPVQASPVLPTTLVPQSVPVSSSPPQPIPVSPSPPPQPPIKSKQSPRPKQGPNYEEALGEIEKSREKRKPSLDLGISNLTMLPPEIGTLTHLTELSLRPSEVTQLPPEIGLLTNLTKLELGHCSLIALPPEIGNLTNLMWLSAFGNELTKLPSELGNLTNLGYLHIAWNPIRELPPEIGNLIRLTEFDIGDNQLLTLPPEIGQLRNIQKLNLKSNLLLTLPQEFLNLTRLSRIGLNGEQLTEFLPMLQQLPRLTEVTLRSNKLSQIPTELWELNHLTKLDLSWNELRTLPPDISKLKNLIELDLSVNKLRTIPEEVGTLPHLTKLDIVNNPISSLPKSLTEKPNLSIRGRKR